MQRNRCTALLVQHQPPPAAINRANKSKLRGALRLMREALTAGDKKSITAVYRSTVSVLDRSVQKGVLHKNTASRYKGRLNARVKAVVLAAPVAAPTKKTAKA